MSHDALEARWAMLRRIGGDRLIRDLIDLLLDTAPGKLAAAQAALANGDAEPIARIAHALASSAGNLGAGQMQEAAYALEREAAGGAADLAAQLDDLEQSWQQARQLLSDRKQGLNP